MEIKHNTNIRKDFIRRKFVDCGGNDPTIEGYIAIVKRGEREEGKKRRRERKKKRNEEKQQDMTTRDGDN